MYYPYFRGKQFELIAIRESATLLADSSFVPIVEMTDTPPDWTCPICHQQTDPIHATTHATRLPARHRP